MTDILKVKVNGEWVGIPAIKGENGEGVPTGGTTGQVLTKKTDTDYDTEWKTLDALPTQTGQSGKYLTTDGSSASWGSISIPQVNNATLTINQGGTLKGTFTANASSNVTVNLDGNQRNIGEIVQSTIPLTDAGLHLLDGALLQYGSYQAFIDYIADLYDSGDYAAIFETEANWQTAVTTYGVCGKFVYDSVNNTVRLPKYNSKIYTGGGTAPVIGNGTTIGFTDGTAQFSLDPTASTGVVYANTSGYGTAVGTQMPSGSAYGSSKTIGLVTDSTKTGIIANLSGITTSVDGYYYIVVATSTKTDIEVDIDEIATDLNGKADVDLTNCTDVANIKMAHNAMPSNTYVDLTLGSDGASYTAPADGYVAFKKVLGSDWFYIAIYVYDSNNVQLFADYCDGYRTTEATVCVPVHKGQRFDVYYNATGATMYFRFIYAQGSESEAS